MSAFEPLRNLKADPESTAATLEAVAEKHLAEFAPDLQRAGITFVAVVAGQQSLAAELFGRAMVEAKAREWFATYARKSSPKGVGAAIEATPQGHQIAAAPEQISVGGHDVGARRGRARFAANAEPINGGGHNVIADAATLVAPPSVDPKSSDGGRVHPASPANRVAPPSARPQSAIDIRAAAIADRHIAKTVFDRRVRDGRRIGSLRYSELDAIRSENLYEAAILDRIKLHATPAPGTDPTIEEMLSGETLERIMGVRNAA